MDAHIHAATADRYAQTVLVAQTATADAATADAAATDAATADGVTADGAARAAHGGVAAGVTDGGATTGIADGGVTDRAAADGITTADTTPSPPFRRGRAGVGGTADQATIYCALLGMKDWF